MMEDFLIQAFKFHKIINDIDLLLILLLSYEIDFIFLFTLLYNVKIIVIYFIIF